MRKIAIFIALIALSISSKAQVWSQVGNTLQRQTNGIYSNYRFNLGSPGFAYFYSKPQVDSIIINGATYTAGYGLGLSAFQFRLDSTIAVNKTFFNSVIGTATLNRINARIPYIGATTDVDLGPHNITTTGSGTFNNYVQSRNLSITNGINQISVSYSPAGISGFRTQYLQDKSGTFAYLDDISSALTGYVPITRSINTTNGILGGSNLGADLTLQVDSTKYQTIANFFPKGDARYAKIGNYITALTGDGYASGPNSAVFTLAGVNSNVGSWGTASSVPTFTVNGKGLITSASNTSIQISESQVTNLTADLAAKANLSGATFSGPVILNADPTTSLGAATKNYVDNIATGIYWKAAVKAATTANITLSGAQTIDGVSLTQGDRVLVKNQTTTTDNGIYIVSAGAWSRSPDNNTGALILASAVYIQAGGTVNGGTQWANSNSSTPTIGTTPITFSQLAGAGVYTNGTGITLTGNVFSLNKAYTDGLYVPYTGAISDVDLGLKNFAANSGFFSGTYTGFALAAYNYSATGNGAYFQGGGTKASQYKNFYLTDYLNNPIAAFYSDEIDFTPKLVGSSFVKSGATTTNLLLAGGGDIPQSTFLTSSTGVSSITGTANQVIASSSTGAVTLSLPQSIATTSTLQFAKLGIGTSATRFLDVLGTTEQMRLAYDATHYVSHTVDVSGNYTIAPTGGTTNITGALVSSNNITAINLIATSAVLMASGVAVNFDRGVSSNYQIYKTGTNLQFLSGGGFSFNGVISSSGFGSVNNVSAAAWGLSSPSFYSGSKTMTDTSTPASTTVSNLTAVAAGFYSPNLAATNTGVTYTTAATMVINGPPIAGTNVTITNPYSLYVTSGVSYFGGNVTLNSLATGTSGTDAILVNHGGIIGSIAANSYLSSTGGSLTGDLTINRATTGSTLNLQNAGTTTTSLSNSFAGSATNNTYLNIIGNNSFTVFTNNNGRFSIDGSGVTLVGYGSDPTSGNKFAVNGNGYFGGTITTSGTNGGTFGGTLKSSGFENATATFGAGSTTPNGFNYTIQGNAASGNVTVALPSAGTYIGIIYIIKKIDSSANTVSITANGSETIDGVATKTISTQYSGYAIQSTGPGWIIIGTF